MWFAASAAATLLNRFRRIQPRRRFFFHPTYVVCCVSSSHSFKPLPPGFNPDGGFSFFRAKERKSPRKKERKPWVPCNA
jgi:hypothetical protein